MNEIVKNKKTQGFNDDVVLRVEHLSKKFCRTLKRSMYYGTIDIARSMLGINYDTGKLRKDEFWALDDVSFELKKGETLGIIGENGSGKSTLLRLITGIFPPDKGKISFKGRIGALIAVGAGFHPHMTGLENIYLNGTILGMTRKELDAKMDEIIDFADIGDFLDAPVNTYSSGMRVRLGFAIAVHCEPDILLVDEVLSVGDISFRNKSMRKMAELKEKAKGLIFISHNIEQVRNLCSKVLVIDKGELLFKGDTHEGIVCYEELSRKSRLVDIKRANFRMVESDEDRIELMKVATLNKDKLITRTFDIKEPITLYFEFFAKEFIEEIFFSYGIVSENNLNCLWGISNDYDKNQFRNLQPGKYAVKVCYSEPHLNVGNYFVNIAIRNAVTFETYYKTYTDYNFSVVSDGKEIERGIVYSQERIEINSI